MKSYTFEMMLKASVTVEADSEEEAGRILGGVLDESASFTAAELDWDGTVLDQLEGECALSGKPTLVRVE